MTTSNSTHMNYPLPGATVNDRRLVDVLAVKAALVAIDAHIKTLNNNAETANTNIVTIQTEMADDVILQNVKAENYVLLLSDNGKQIFHPGTDITARNWTIPSNAVVGFKIGTAITLINAFGAGNITLNINVDTLRLSGSGATGTRILGATGVATIIKITQTEWIISGTNIT